jgi:hypothetical protein
MMPEAIKIKPISAKGFLILLSFLGIGTYCYPQVAPVTRLSSEGNLKPGQAIILPVIVKGFAGIGSVALSTDYDTTSLEFVSAEVNPVLSSSGMSDIGNNYLSGRTHRLIFGWYGTNASLPDSSWIVKYSFTYHSGNSTLSWYDNGPSCGYTNQLGIFLTDTPAKDFYIDGNVCAELAAPGAITGPDTVRKGATGTVFSVSSVAGYLGYIWTFPPGAVITSNPDSNLVLVDFPAGSRAGTVKVSGRNICGAGYASTKDLYVLGGPNAIGDLPRQDPETRINGLNIYPNPASGEVCIKHDLVISGKMIIRVISSTGTIVRESELFVSAGGGELRIDISGLPGGIYFISAGTGSNQRTGKLIIR